MAVQKSSFTLRQLLTRIQSDAGMRGQALITIEDAVRWGNRAQNRIARQTKWYRKSTTLGTTNGTKAYDWPTDFLSVSEMYHDGIPLRLVTEKGLHQYSYDWRNEASGTPQYFYRTGFAGYSLHPTPDTTDSDIVTLHYAALPPAVSDGDDFFTVPTALEEAIECFCGLQAAIKDASGEGRERLVLLRQEWAKWEGEIASFIGSAGEGEILILGSDNVPGGVEDYDVFWNHVVV